MSKQCHHFEFQIKNVTLNEEIGKLKVNFRLEFSILLYIFAPLKSASLLPPSLKFHFLSYILVHCPHELLNSWHIPYLRGFTHVVKLSLCS